MFAGDLGEDVSGRPGSRLLSDRSQLGKGFSVSAGNVRRVPEHIDLRVVGHRQVWFDVDPAAVTLRQSGYSPTTSTGFSPPPQTTVWVRIVSPSLSMTRSGEHLLDADAMMQCHAVILQLVRSIGMGLVRERCQQHHHHDRQDAPGPAARATVISPEPRL